MGSIYLIRHGQASFGADDYDVLSPTGIRQAEILGEHLGHLGLSFDRCLAGTLRRQQHTATSALQRCVAAGLPAPELEIDAAFNEFDAEAVIRGLIPAMLADEPDAMRILRNPKDDRAAFQHLFARIIRRWITGEYDQPGHETWQGFLDNVRGGLERLLAQTERQQNIAIFTSGGTITAAIHLLTGVPADKAFELNWQIVNTSLSRLHFRNGEATLASFNSRVHLELLKAPELITYR
ncbi:histidine phosphatase family protein [Aquipseudomonas ullengensis]|uniref:Histidine phosphatase family protein n=1 Tax=Aquipseudomonas ullengensis TaxID=2759166 RepID=A0A7W4LQA2_9GAMM|nr:histidine phosphatase family protein [Pseudomonas ullengensis]MBB2497210.1 histidine phosphatase family protein [Pseudomonas ullengensis]